MRSTRTSTYLFLISGQDLEPLFFAVIQSDKLFMLLVLSQEHRNRLVDQVGSAARPATDFAGVPQISEEQSLH